MSENSVLGQPQKDRLSISFGYKFISLTLLAVIAIMLLVWKPWVSTANADDRTISVTGKADIKAEPDEYVFNPSYQFKNIDKAAALKNLTAKSSELIAKLKGMGVEDRNIKTDSNGYDYQRYYYNNDTKESTYTLVLTVTLANRDKAQKVQDYLVTTDPTGSISPNVTFSDSKRKALESQARDLATKEARSKAEQSAKNLGFKVGAVKAVQDGSGFGNIYPMQGRASLETSSEDAKLDVQPGQNDLSYTVNVVYFVK